MDLPVGIIIRFDVTCLSSRIPINDFCKLGYEPFRVVILFKKIFPTLCRFSICIFAGALCYFRLFALCALILILHCSGFLRV